MISSKVKYGLISAGIWLVIQLITFLLAHHIRVTPLLVDTPEVLRFTVYLLLTAVVAYIVGYYCQKGYLVRFYAMQSNCLDLSKGELINLLKHRYVYKWVGFITLLLIITMPWFIIANMGNIFSIREYLLLGTFFLLSLFFFWYYVQKEW